MNNEFMNNVARNQNCYETDSSEYASDFAPNAAEQRIDYLYLRNNQVSWIIFSLLDCGGGGEGVVDIFSVL